MTFTFSPIQDVSPIDFTNERLQIGDTGAHVSKMNSYMDKIEGWTDDISASLNSINVVGNQLASQSVIDSTTLSLLTTAVSEAEAAIASLQVSLSSAVDLDTLQANVNAANAIIESLGENPVIGQVVGLSEIVERVESLAPISQTISILPVAFCIYDTRKDSDGGAWRHRCHNTSWYNEELNTAIRGARREFPSDTAISAEAALLTVYDLDNPDASMWKVYDFSGDSINSVAARNGMIFVAMETGLHVIDLITDSSNSYSTISTPAIVNDACNGVAITVLNSAPIDAATGLPVPTIAVATDGGASIINGPAGVGTIVNWTRASYGVAGSVNFRGDGALCVAFDISAVDRFRHVLHTLPSADLVDTHGYLKGESDEFYPMNYSSAYVGTSLILAKVNPQNNSNKFIGIADAGNAQLSLIHANPAEPEKGMLAAIKTNSTSGWRVGDTKVAVLGSTDTGSVSVDDLSYNDNTLTQVGSLAPVPVATGAELVAASGFSATDYLEQAYNADLDFGTGDFSIMGWYKGSASGSVAVLYSRQSDQNNGIQIYRNAVAGSSAVLGLRLNTDFFNSSLPGDYDGWIFVAVTRENGIARIYQNAVLGSELANSQDISATSPVTQLGWSTAQPRVIGPEGLALWRVSSSVPSVDQITKVYNDERKLFQENAQCTLYGTSDVVNDVAHDQYTGLIHAATSSGRSSFDGLVRVGNTTQRTTHIAADGGLIIEGES